MKIFIIHSGKDIERVEKIIANLLERQLANPEILLLKNVPVFWKFIAQRKIKQSDLVFFFVGENSHESKNIDWEIKTALKLKKAIYIIKLDNNNKLNSILKADNGYCSEEAIDVKEITLSEFYEARWYHN